MTRKCSAIDKTKIPLILNFEKDESLLNDIGSPIKSNWKGIGLDRRKSIAPSAFK